MAAEPPRVAGGEGRPAAIVVLDDTAIVREGIRMVVSRAPDLEVVGDAAPDSSAAALVARLEPDIVLTEVRGGERPDLELVRMLAQRAPGVRVALFTSRADQDLLWEALEAGARGYILKDSPVETVLDAVRRILGGESWVDDRMAPDVLRQLQRPRSGGVLSEREREILQMLADGASNRDVSERLVVSVETVKTHVKHILAKLESRHRTQAVAVGIRRNLIR